MVSSKSSRQSSKARFSRVSISLPNLFLIPVQLEAEIFTMSTVWLIIPEISSAIDFLFRLVPGNKEARVEMQSSGYRVPSQLECATWRFSSWTCNGDDLETTLWIFFVMMALFVVVVDESSRRRRDEIAKIDRRILIMLLRLCMVSVISC